MVFPLDLNDKKQKYTAVVLFVLLILLMVSSSISISNYNAIKAAEADMDAISSATSAGMDIVGDGGNIELSSANSLEVSALKLEASNGWSIFVLVLSILGLGSGAGMIIYDKMRV
jgi:hypothetical protein